MGHWLQDTTSAWNLPLSGGIGYIEDTSSGKVLGLVGDGIGHYKSTWCKSTYESVNDKTKKNHEQVHPLDRLCNDGLDHQCKSCL